MPETSELYTTSSVLADGRPFEYAELVGRVEFRLLRLIDEDDVSYPLKGAIRGELRHVSLERLCQWPFISSVPRHVILLG